MARILNQYFEGRETSANAIRAMGINVPPIVMTDFFPDGYTAENIRKIFNLLPVEEIEIDMHNSLDIQGRITAALTHGHYLKRVRLLNCYETIDILPTTVTAVEIQTEQDILPLRNIAKMENIRKIAMIGGRVDMQTLIHIMNRSTWLEELDLCEAEITTAAGLCRAASKIMEIITTDVKIDGKSVTREDVNKILFGEP